MSRWDEIGPEFCSVCGFDIASCICEVDPDSNCKKCGYYWPECICEGDDD